MIVHDCCHITKALNKGGCTNFFVTLLILDREPIYSNYLLSVKIMSSPFKTLSIASCLPRFSSTCEVPNSTSPFALSTSEEKKGGIEMIYLISVIAFFPIIIVKDDRGKLARSGERGAYSGVPYWSSWSALNNHLPRSTAGMREVSNLFTSKNSKNLCNLLRTNLANKQRSVWKSHVHVPLS